MAVFMCRIADQTGNAMSDCKNVYLPLFDKVEVYKLFAFGMRSWKSEPLLAQATSTPSGKSPCISSKFDEWLDSTCARFEIPSKPCHTMGRELERGWLSYRLLERLITISSQLRDRRTR